MFGFYETLVEYYTGRDASQMSDNALAIKVAHIEKIRKMESIEGANNLGKLFG